MRRQHRFRTFSNGVNGIANPTAANFDIGALVQQPGNIPAPATAAAFHRRD